MNTILKALHDPKDKKVLVAAHRGDWRNAPENSLLAFQYAMEMGVDIVELDLAKTKDGEIIIMHDQTIDRTTDGHGKPGDYTLAEIKKLHLRNGLGRVTDHTIPTLEEAMLLMKNRVMVNLDKSFPYYNEAFAILKKTGTLKQGLFKTDEKLAVVKEKYGALLSSIMFMAVVSLDRPDAAKVISEYQTEVIPVAFEMIFKADTSAILKDNIFIRNRGAKIWINSLWASLNGGHDDDLAIEKANIKNSWEWIINHGATIIQTDRPRELLLYLHSHALH